MYLQCFGKDDLHGQIYLPNQQQHSYAFEIPIKNMPLKQYARMKIRKAY